MSALRSNIMRVLRNATVALSKAEIAARMCLAPPASEQTREAWRAFEHELFRLGNEGEIGMAYPNAQRPEFNFWSIPAEPRPTFSAEARP